MPANRCGREASRWRLDEYYPSASDFQRWERSPKPGCPFLSLFCGYLDCSQLQPPTSTARKDADTSEEQPPPGPASASARRDAEDMPTYPFVWSGKEVVGCLFLGILSFVVTTTRGVIVSRDLPEDSPGLMPGYLYEGSKIDLFDTQWRVLRSFMPLLITGLLVHVFLSSAIRRYFRWKAGKTRYTAARQNEPSPTPFSRTAQKPGKLPDGESNSKPVELESVIGLASGGDDGAENDHQQSWRSLLEGMCSDCQSFYSSSQGKLHILEGSMSPSGSRMFGKSQRRDGKSQRRDETFLEEGALMEKQDVEKVAAELSQKESGQLRMSKRRIVPQCLNSSSKVAVGQLGSMSPETFWLLIFQVIIGFGATVFMHGFHVCFIWFYAIVNYSFTYFLRRPGKYGKFGPCVVWTFMVIALIANGTILNRLKFHQISTALSFMDVMPEPYAWEDAFRLVALKMLSFDMDLFWASQAREERIQQMSGAGDGEASTGRQRQSHRIQCVWSLPARSQQSLCLEHYNVLEYWAYLFYIPLYLAGPTVTFNAWSSQVRVPWKEVAGCVLYCERQEEFREQRDLLMMPQSDGSGSHSASGHCPHLSPSRDASTSIGSSEAKKTEQSPLKSSSPCGRASFCWHRPPPCCWGCGGVQFHRAAMLGAATIRSESESHSDAACHQITMHAGARHRQVSHVVGDQEEEPLQESGRNSTHTALEEVEKERNRNSRVARKILLYYSIRWVVLLAVMEVFSHFIYARAIMGSPIRDNLWRKWWGPDHCFVFTLSLVSIMTKFMVIWRLFRLWGLLDGIDSPENMSRCIYNCYSTEQFWRCWHRSFNQWLVRYIYVPLSGSQKGTLRRCFNIFVVFTFVALWHEINWRLFLWGWLMSAGLVPELALKAWAFPRGWQTSIPKHDIRKRWFFKYICITAAMMNIFVLVAANLIGYGSDEHGKSTLFRLFSRNWEEGLTQFLSMAAIYWVGAYYQMPQRYVFPSHGY